MIYLAKRYQDKDLSRHRYVWSIINTLDMTWCGDQTPDWVNIPIIIEDQG